MRSGWPDGGRAAGGGRGPEAHLFFSACWLSFGAKADWPHFARWHYRSHHLALVRRVILLWHEERPIGVCVFAAPASALRLRHRFFGIKPSRDPLWLKRLNEQLWALARVVLHPTYRGAGLAAQFVRAACRLCPVPWIETLSAMGQLNPFFERAGFVRVGVIRKDPKADAKGHARIYGGRRLSAETTAKSRHAEPVYYVFDNRASISDCGFQIAD